MSSQSAPHHHTVLVVDDDEVVLQRLLELLSCDDYTIVSASNGLAALERLKEALPSIALLDVHMPEMDGLALCRLMKQDPHTADVPILHDIGKLLLAVELPDHLQKALLETQASGCAMYIAEERLWGVTHAEVGGYLLGLWGLPLPIIEAVASHHVPSRLDANEFDILAATHIADVMVHAELDGQVSTKQSVALDLAFIDRIGASDKLDTWRKQVSSHVRKRGDLKA